MKDNLKMTHQAMHYQNLHVKGINNFIFILQREKSKNMEKDVLSKYNMNCRDDVVKFLKSLWNETPQLCPLCNGTLDFLHKKQ